MQENTNHLENRMGDFLGSLNSMGAISLKVHYEIASLSNQLVREAYRQGVEDQKEGKVR